MTDLHKQYTMEDVKAVQAYFKQQKIGLLDEAHICLTDASKLMEAGPVDETLVLIHSEIMHIIRYVETYTKELLK